MTLDVQLLTMITMVAGGVYIGFAVDTYSRLTKKIRSNPIFHYGLTMIFWLLQIGVLYYALFQVNEGVLRIYVFLACLLGYSMYALMFRRGYRAVLETCIHIVKTILIWITEAINVLLIQPVLWLLRLVYSIVKWLILFIVTMLKYPIRLLLIFLEWVLPEVFLKKVFQLYGSCSTMKHNLMITLRKFFRKWR